MEILLIYLGLGVLFFGWLCFLWPTQFKLWDWVFAILLNVCAWPLMGLVLTFVLISAPEDMKPMRWSKK